MLVLVVGLGVVLGVVLGVALCVVPKWSPISFQVVSTAVPGSASVGPKARSSLTFIYRFSLCRRLGTVTEYYSERFFCEVYPTNASFNLCEFILSLIMSRLRNDAFIGSKFCIVF